MSTAVRKGGTSFEWGAPTEVFQPSGEIVGLYGDRFLAVESQTSDSAADSSFEAILNWEALVDQR